MRPKTVRCAIYTRKSTEHNLDLEFNSLHAQREACEAYIKSQMHEGSRSSGGNRNARFCRAPRDISLRPIAGVLHHIILASASHSRPDALDQHVPISSCYAVMGGNLRTGHRDTIISFSDTAWPPNHVGFTINV